MTATATPPVTRALMARLAAEDAAERTRQRAEALEELPRVEKQALPAAQKADKDIAAAVEAVAKARETLAAAAAALGRAHTQKRTTLYPLNRRLETLRAQLEGSLRPVEITDALAAVDDVRASCHVSDDRDVRLHTQAVIAWCQTARTQLLALQFVAVDDMATAVATILDSQP